MEYTTKRGGRRHEGEGWTENERGKGKDGWGEGEEERDRAQVSRILHFCRHKGGKREKITIHYALTVGIRNGHSLPVARYPYCRVLKTIKSLYRSPLTHQSWCGPCWACSGVSPPLPSSPGAANGRGCWHSTDGTRLPASLAAGPTGDSSDGADLLRRPPLSVPLPLLRHYRRR